METQDLVNAALTVLLFVILVAPHEFAHAWIAMKLGDNTPVEDGRVTLNPLVHIDWLGTVILPGLMSLLGGGLLGWGRPVMTNPARLRGGSHGLLKVALAGPAMNVLLAFPFAALTAILASSQPAVAQFCARATYLTIFLAIFNMMPVPPLDGSKFLIVAKVPPTVFHELARMGFLILILAMMFTPLGSWMYSTSVGSATALVRMFAGVLG
jgi:Zn-dependent protease